MNQIKLPQISEAEYKVMKVVWANAPITTNDIVASLANSSDWSPKTIQTLLTRLVKKDALAHEKQGRMFVYHPLVKEEDYREEASKSFLRRFYDGALNSMVLNFIEQDKLSSEEIQELREILDAGARKK